MPQFSYTAKQGPQRIIDGRIEAGNLDQAICKVIEMGFTPLDVVPFTAKSIKSESRKNFGLDMFFDRVPMKDVAQFTRQMADLMEAAVPILRSLKIVEMQTTNKKLRSVINEICDFVKDGGSFSNSLARHSRIFPVMYINLVKTGEESGQLETIFNRLAEYLEKEQQSRSKVASSMAYPLLVLLLGIVTVFVLLTFVIPRLSGIFEEFDQMLPWPTMFLMNLSAFFLKYGWIILLVLVAGGTYLAQWLQTPSGRQFLDARKLELPLLGSFFLQVEFGRFARTLGTLLGNGVAISTALDASCAAMENVILKKEMQKVLDEVKMGSPLRAALKQSLHCPVVALQIISVGEETGHLDRSLMKVAETYERQTTETTTKIVSLLGPLFLLVIVSMVGFVVLAMLLPILKMNLLVQ